jgi:hypothetical protein
MRTDSFSPESLQAAYTLAAENNNADLQEFAEQSKVFDFSLSIDVLCDTTLPVSTPAELREKKFQSALAKSQNKANVIAKKQAAVAERLAKRLERKMRKEQRGRIQ